MVRKPRLRKTLLNTAREILQEQDLDTCDKYSIHRSRIRCSTPRGDRIGLDCLQRFDDEVAASLLVTSATYHQYKLISGLYHETCSIRMVKVI